MGPPLRPAVPPSAVPELSGPAGLVAGAFSMATGEFTSVRSQNELVGAEVAVERRALLTHPEEERRELTGSLVRRGVDPELARAVSEQISRDPDNALEFHTQEELGVDPAQLPSPLHAAGLSFAAFAIGALVPLLPYLPGATVLWASVAVTAFALAISGGVVAELTSRPMVLGAVRQLALATLSAGVTYAVGHAIGAAVTS